MHQAGMSEPGADLPVRLGVRWASSADGWRMDACGVGGLFPLPGRVHLGRLGSMGLMYASGPLGPSPAGTFNFEPPPPGSALYLEPTPKRLRVIVGGEAIAESARAVRRRGK